jgi:hypothetical protein
MLSENFIGIIVMAILCLISFVFSFVNIDEIQLSLKLIEIIFSILVIGLTFRFAAFVNAKNMRFNDSNNDIVVLIIH